MTLLINRVTFEKGKANFLKLLSKRIHDFELSLVSKTIFEKSRVEIADYLKALRFAIKKFEIIMLTGMVECLRINKDESFYMCRATGNPLGIPERDWQSFLEESDKDKVQRTLEKEISIEKQFEYRIS